MAKTANQTASPETDNATFTNAPLISGNRFIRIGDVMRETGLPRSTIYFKVKCGLFPGPVRLSPRISAWEASVVRAWAQARIDESAIAGKSAKNKSAE